jgi:hypothetical protein
LDSSDDDDELAVVVKMARGRQAGVGCRGVLLFFPFLFLEMAL